MFIFNLYGTNWGVVLAASTLTGALVFPGANMAIAVTVALALLIFNALGTAWMAVIMPRSGGDYIWNTYTLKHSIGFIFTWGMFLNAAFAIGIYSALTINYGASATLATLGTLLSNSWLVSAGSAAATANWTFIGGTIAIWVSVPFFVIGPRVSRAFMWGIFVPCVIGIILALALLTTATNASFISAFNSAMHSYTNSSNSYQSVINTATQAGGTLPAASLLASVAALPLGFWSFVGYNNSINLAGEIKTPNKSQPLAVIASLIATWAVLAFAFERFYDVVGWNFNSALAYLFNVAPSHYTLPVPPTFNFFVSMLTSNPIISGLIGISFILWIFMLIGPMFLLSSRYIFNFSFNRVTPSVFAHINNRGSPSVAVVLMAVLGEIFLTLYVYSGALSLVNYTMVFAIVYVVDGFSMLLVYRRRKDLFSAAPGYVKKKIGALPLLSIFGAINIVFFAFIIYFSILTPAFSGPVGPASFAVLLGIFLSGALIYGVASLLRKREGIDLGLISREIPPE